MVSDHERVRMEEKDWTPFRNEFFRTKFGTLQKKKAAALYCILYDRAYHHGPAPVVKATLSEISKWSGFDARVVKRTLKELREKKLIRRKRRGTKRSRTDKPVWEVPLAKPNLSLGGWTPIPRLIIHEYIPVFPNAVLLLVLLAAQHIQWLDYSWIGERALLGKLNWSGTRVRDALRTMYESKRWKKLHRDLPRPLDCEVEATEGSYGERRHYRVRVVRYETKGRTKIVRLSTQFAKHFGLKLIK